MSLKRWSKVRSACSVKRVSLPLLKMTYKRMCMQYVQSEIALDITRQLNKEQSPGNTELFIDLVDDLVYLEVVNRSIDITDVVISVRDTLEC